MGGSGLSKSPKSEIPVQEPITYEPKIDPIDFSDSKYIVASTRGTSLSQILSHIQMERNMF
jgi:hypothetical protein